MLSTLDYVVLLGYIVAVTWFGLHASGRQKSTTDYFLGGKSLPWWAVCFSIVATETSTLTVIGIPAVAYGGTMTFWQLTLGYLLGRSVVAAVFLPRFFKGEITTAYAFLGNRFGPRIQMLASLTFMGTRLLADGVRLFATAIPLKVIADSAGLNVGYTEIIVAIGLLTIVYTFYGGLKAVVWMDVVQMGLYLLAALVTIVILLRSLEPGVLETLQFSQKLKVFDWGHGGIAGILTSPYVFVTAVIGGGIFSMASHGTDHLIVQRLLACATLRESRKALITSAFVVMVQFALFLAVGVLLWVHYGGVSVTELGLGRADEVFPKFIIEGLPAGISGLVLAGILAAAMSTLSSSLNALAASSVLDFSRVRDDADLLLRSRLWTLFWGVTFMVFAGLFTDRQNPVVELGLSIASFTYGALLGAFLLALFFKRVQELDAMIGFASSVIFMTIIIFGLWYSPGSGWIFNLNPTGDTISQLNLVSLAWPWYTTLGTLITVAVGSLLSLRHR